MLERPVLPLWAAVAAAAAGGFALDAAFPSLGWWPLAFVAVTLSLLSLIGRSLWGAVLVGAAFGAAFLFPHLSWASQFLGDTPGAWVPWVALASVETLVMAALTPLIVLAYRWLPRWRDTRPVRLVALPALVAGTWLARELVMGSWPYGGFPWGRLGLSQSESPIAPVASWVGVSGLGFLMVALCAAMIEAVRWSRREPLRDTSGRARWRARWVPVFPVSVLAVVLLAVPQFPTADAGTMRVGVAQGNGPAAYVDQREPDEILDSQLDASAPLEDEQTDLVLWPEGGVDSDPANDVTTSRILDEAAARYGSPILLNAASEDGGLRYNTSFLWTRDGAVATHAKRHPVPFGEYVPDRWLYGAIVPDLVNLLQREYTPGDDAPVVDTGDVRIGLAICFDVAFDDVIREGVLDGGQVLMFQTNNADFRGTDENLQQLAIARMRAIETGRTVINLSTTGTSQALAPDGTTLDALPIDGAGLMVVDAELRDGVTAGILLGPSLQALMLWGSLAALAVLGVAGTRRRT
ncbi:apolipoprotein N-acyltransferase [Promicromonospora sp. AC04]|uniref:apolipoprotein N-acyltransferase n=1 Tax=Promicromonospora sp. AC04 TaxID=2135723 RepID=UPI000D3B60BE|nr:apolipoprotein N-acyltransferase [Promicromonospora sp. AC04]PUB31973.1 apolipoprotein N-acyltransferase [Promicromonospora sp. AC04]